MCVDKLGTTNQEERWARGLVIWALKRGASLLFPATQIAVVELIKPEGRTEAPFTWGQCPLFRNSKHTGTVLAYTYTCIYVNLFCQMVKGQQDQMIYIFDKNIKISTWWHWKCVWSCRSSILKTDLKWEKNSIRISKAGDPAEFAL